MDISKLTLSYKRLLLFSIEYGGYVIWFDRDTYNRSNYSNLLNSLKAKNNVEIYKQKKGTGMLIATPQKLITYPTTLAEAIARFEF